jgi:SAM-dependent methyltransferase
MVPWFSSWFDSAYYHKLYGYRDDGEAAGFVDELIDRLRPQDGSAVLDVGCGAGRHARYLASKGFLVTGIDLAATSIQRAKRFERSGVRFLRHDMRVPFGKNAFDYVCNFFTSFGYFEQPAEHLGIVRNMAESLKRGGTLVLDYLNVPYADAHLTHEEVKRIDGTTYRLTRWIEADHFFKRIVIEDDRADDPIEHVERVARFQLQDFQRMFTAQGLDIEAAYGDYALNPYHPQNSPRLIVTARKRGARSS